MCSMDLLGCHDWFSQTAPFKEWEVDKSDKGEQKRKTDFKQCRQGQEKSFTRLLGALGSSCGTCWAAMGSDSESDCIWVRDGCA